MSEPNISVSQREQIIGLRGERLGGRAIAKRVGLPYGRVRRLLEKMDPLPPDGSLKPGQATFRALVYDLECSNLKSDLGLLLCCAFLDLADGSIVSKTIDSFGPRERGEHALVLWVKGMVEGADCLIGHNSIAFDKNYLNGVLARYNESPLPKRLHIDTYQAAKYGWTGLPCSYSLRNLSGLFGLAEEKQSLDVDEWRTALADPVALEALRVHCERDVAVTALLWQRIKPFYFSWRGR